MNSSVFFEPNQERKAFPFEWSDDHFSSRLSNRPIDSSALPASDSPLSKTLPIFLPKISSIIPCLLSPLAFIDTSFVSIFLLRWISQSRRVALSKVSLKPPLTPFRHLYRKPLDSSILVQETSGFHQRVNTWIVSSFRLEALGQSLLGVYRVPCEEL